MALRPDEVGSPPGFVEWIREARAGSTEALGRVLEFCRGYLLLIANNQLATGLRGKVAPSDLVQQTFLEAHRDFAQFEGESEAEMLAWLRRILLNTLANTVRDLNAEKRQVTREIALTDRAAGSLPDARQAAESTDDPLEKQEETRRLERAIAGLPADYREILRLRHQHGLSFVAAGQAMGRSPDAVRKLWRRAVEQLQAVLETPDDDP